MEEKQDMAEIENMVETQNMEEKQIKENRYKGDNSRIRKLVYYLLGIIEFFFAFRLVFKLLGAKGGSIFVSLIYTVSGTLMTPFNGIFGATENSGEKIKSVFEPTIIMSMIVYALIAYGIVRLFEIYKTPRDSGLE